MSQAYSRRRQEGKCSSCGHQSRPGKATCQTCADKRKLTFQERRSQGICTECTERASPGRTRCVYHLEQRSVYQKQLAKERFDKGMCTNCGKQVLEDGKVLCKRCSGKSLTNVHRNHFMGNRNLTIERDHYRCQICGKTTSLTVHHKDGIGFGTIKPNHDLSNLITLCRHCHAAITTLRSNNRELAIELISY